MIGTRRTRRGFVFAVTGVAIATGALVGCSSPGNATTGVTNPASTAVASTAAAPNASAETALYSAMHQLWAQHMEWTYATVDAFFHDQNALNPTLGRLLQNQRDIGAAIAPYYGQDAANKLTDLLLAHINDAVPVLQAAKDGNTNALNTATAAWYDNAKQIADLLSSANPTNWPTSATEPILHDHITQTVAYSVDLLKGNYPQAITDYDMAEQHMAMLADTLSKGIIAQFPGKFAS